MYRILIPVDTDVLRGFSQAEYVADLPGADAMAVTLTHVFDEPPAKVPESMRRAERVEAVREAAEYLEGRVHSVEIRDATSPIDEGILELAEALDADQIVMSGGTRGPIAKALLGDLTQTVVMNTDRPVAVVGDEREWEP